MADTSKDGQAGAEIEVTPEMIEAGAQILEDAFDAPKESARSYAKEIYVVMSALQARAG